MIGMEAQLYIGADPWGAYCYNIFSLHSISSTAKSVLYTDWSDWIPRARSRVRTSEKLNTRFVAAAYLVPLFVSLRALRRALRLCAVRNEQLLSLSSSCSAWARAPRCTLHVCAWQHASHFQLGFVGSELPKQWGRQPVWDDMGQRCGWAALHAHAEHPHAWAMLCPNVAATIAVAHSD